MDQYSIHHVHEWREERIFTSIKICTGQDRNFFYELLEVRASL